MGDLSALFITCVAADSMEGSIPETVFVMFQMTFAIITPRLIIGAFVERMKFPAVMLFSVLLLLWLILAYAPTVHWLWPGSGWVFNDGTIDVAGGSVVHATAGASALAFAKMLGQRTGFPSKL